MSKHTHFFASAGRRLAPIGLAAALPAACLLAPATASADTFNVVAGDASSLQSALNQAASHANAGGPDVVSVPAGAYAGNFSYNGDPVVVEGVDRATTELTASTGTTFLLVAPQSTVRNLSIENTQSGVIGSALWLTKGGTVQDVELTATGNNVYGLRSVGDTAVMGARIVVGPDNTGLLQNGAGTMTISRATIEASGGSSSVGVRADAVGAAVQAARLRSLGVSRPLSATFGGSLTVRDSLLVLPAGAPATAFEVGDQNNLTNFTSNVAADRVTVIGDPAANQTGARVYANSAGDDFEVSIHDSLLRGVMHPLSCDSSAGKGRTTADWSSLPPTGDGSGGAGCTVARTNPVAGTPIFVDAPGGDYHQRYDSPLVDAGDPAPLTAIDDLDGLGRPVGRTDLGAYEYQGQSASPPTTVTIAPPGSASDRAPTITLFVRSRLSLAKALRRGIPATVGCSVACGYRTSLLLDARTAKRLHISRRVASGQRTTNLTGVGRRTIRIKLARRARTALRNVASVKLTVRATATDRAGNTSASRTRRTTLRR